MHVRFAAFALLSLVLSACGGGSPTPSAPLSSDLAPTGALPVATTPAATTAGVATPGAIDWSNLDVCALLDEKAVQEITGESEVGFTTNGAHQEVSGGRCFWGATRAGVPAYVEIEVGNSKGVLFGYKFQGQTCSESPVAGVGTAALGGTCPAPPQRKVFLVAYDQGVQVRVLVNEPKRPLDPGDLAAYVNAALQDIR